MEDKPASASLLRTSSIMSSKSFKNSINDNDNTSRSSRASMASSRSSMANKNGQTARQVGSKYARILPDGNVEELGRRQTIDLKAMKEAAAIEEKQRNNGLAPLFMFLTSSLNVEMVYVILQGISQFSLLNFVKDGLSKDQLKRFQQMEYIVKDGDITVILRQVEIKNADKWSATSGRDMVTDIGRVKTLADGG